MIGNSHGLLQIGNWKLELREKKKKTIVSGQANTRLYLLLSFFISFPRIRQSILHSPP